MKKESMINYMNLNSNFLNKLNLANNSKKSQVSVFIIIVIVIIATIGIIYYSGNSSSGINRQFSSDAAVQKQFETLRDSVLVCKDITTIEALNTIGIQGGYYDAPEKYFDLKWAFIPYYYYEGTPMVPSNTKVEGELTKFVNDNLKLCIDDIEKNDFSVDYKEPKTSVKINPGNVVFNIDMPISISKEKKSVTLDLKKSPLSYDSPLMDILDLAGYITNETIENDKMVCLSCITKAAADKNLYVDLINIEEGGTLVVIFENYTASGPYALEFLNKYKG